VLENSPIRRTCFVAFRRGPFAINEPRRSSSYGVFRPVALKPLSKYRFDVLRRNRIVRRHEHEKGLANLCPLPYLCKQAVLGAFSVNHAARSNAAGTLTPRSISTVILELLRRLGSAARLC
jgi:hypothetical protein